MNDGLSVDDQKTSRKSYHLPNCKAGVDFIELIADKAQVFFHPRNIGIGEVRTIKLVEELADSLKLTHENRTEQRRVHN